MCSPTRCPAFDLLGVLPETDLRHGCFPFAPQGETQEVSINLSFTGFGFLHLPLVVEVAELTHELLFAMKTSDGGLYAHGYCIIFQEVTRASN